MDGFINSLIPFFRRFAVESFFLGTAFVLTVASFIIFYRGTPAATDYRLKEETFSVKTKEVFLMVEVSGAVEKPGAYEIASGARLKDVILKAGGLSDEADKDFFSRNFNLARYVADQEKIHIPALRDVENGIYNEREQIIDYRSPQTPPLSQKEQILNDKIHINSAEGEDLEALPGIGKATANKIIQNRPYASLEELVSKKAVSVKMFGQIQEYIDL